MATRASPNRPAALAALCEAVGAGWIRVGPDRRVLEVSPLAAKLLEIDAASTIGQSCLTAVRCKQCVGSCPASSLPQLDERVEVYTATGPRDLRRIALPDDSGNGDIIELLMPAEPAVASVQREEGAARVGTFATADPQLQVELERAALLARHDALWLVQGPCPGERLALVAAAFGLCAETCAVRVIPARSLVHQDRFVVPADLDALRPSSGKGRGVVVLDEIDQVPLSAQVALMQFMATRGSCQLKGEGPRIVATLRGPLEEAMRSGRLDPLLARSLRPGRVVVPALRCRPADIELRVMKVLTQLGGGRPAPITEAAWRRLRSYAWPGEVGELRAVLAAAFALAGGRIIEVAHLPEEIREPGARAEGEPDRVGPGLSSQKVRAAIVAADGNLAEAAEELGVSRATLWRWRKRLGLQ